MTKQQKFLFEPTSNLSGGVETLNRMLNDIAVELERLGFPELIDPEQMDAVFENPRAAIEKTIITRVKGEGRTLGGLPMSDAGILGAVELPDLSFFKGNWRPPEGLWLDLFKYGKVVTYHPGKRRYEVDDAALDKKVDKSAILATPENMQLYEKLNQWVELTNDIGFTNGDFREKLGKNLAHPHGHSYMSRALFELAADKRRTMASRAK